MRGVVDDRDARAALVARHVDDARAEQLEAQAGELARRIADVERIFERARPRHLLATGELLPEPKFAERIRVMCRHLDLMVEVFGEEHGCRMFRKVAPWYAKRFGPANEFNKKVVAISSRAEFHDVLERYLRWREQFCDGDGNLLPRFALAPMVASFMQDPASAQRQSLPVPKGPVEVW